MPEDCAVMKIFFDTGRTGSVAVSGAYMAFCKRFEEGRAAVLAVSRRRCSRKNRNWSLFENLKF
jgi:hypothetical protein